MRVMVARRERDLTQEELADKVGILRADVSRIESQGWIPPPDVQLKMAAVLRSTITDLFNTESVA